MATKPEEALGFLAAMVPTPAEHSGEGNNLLSACPSNLLNFVKKNRTHLHPSSSVPS
jgi:hypothetical protein